MKLKQFLDKPIKELMPPLPKRTDRGKILSVYTDGMPETWTQTRAADRTFGTIPTSEPVDPNELCLEILGSEFREGQRPKIVRCQNLKSQAHPHPGQERMVGSI